jgi:nicotinamidase-related amidase
MVAILGAILEDYTDVVIYGVYTEVCVGDAMRGLQQFSKQLHLVTDATADICDDGLSFRERWRNEGVDLTNVAEITSRLEIDHWKNQSRQQ